MILHGLVGCCPNGNERRNAAAIAIIRFLKSISATAAVKLFFINLKDASVMSAVVVGTVVVRTFALSKQSERPLLAREHKISNGAKGLGILAP